MTRDERQHLLARLRRTTLRAFARKLKPLVELALEDAKVERLRIVDLKVGEHSLSLTQRYIGFTEKGTLNGLEGAIPSAQVTGDPASGRLYGFSGVEETVAWLSDIGAVAPDPLVVGLTSLISSTSLHSGAGSTIFEVGEQTAAANFSASYQRGAADVTGTLSAATMQDNQGGAVDDVIAQGTPNSIQYEFPAGTQYQKTALNASVQFTLSATEGGDTVNTNSTFRWRPAVYWGVALQPGAYDEAFIEGLPSSALAASRNLTFTVNAGPGEHIYYAYPDAYGDATFTVRGFAGGFLQKATGVLVTNVFLHGENYRVYESVNPNLSSTEVVVS